MSILSSNALGHQALGTGALGSAPLCQGASFVLTGQPAAMGPSYASARGTFTWSGVAAVLNRGLTAAAGAFNLSPQNASLKWSGVVFKPTVVDPTGTSDDILGRVKQLLPKRWFSWVAPYRDALLGGLSDLAAWCYRLIKYARAQTRLSTAYGIWLDILGYDFLGRNILRNGANDDTYRAVIRATILQERVTRAGMLNAIVTLTGRAPWIFEPWNTYDTGAYSGASVAYGSFGYGVGRGGYGNMNLPCQTFLLVHKGAGAGVPGIGGYGTAIDGYGVGSTEYIGPQSEQSGITIDMVYRLINATKPTGTTCWTQVIV